MLWRKPWSATWKMQAQEHETVIEPRQWTHGKHDSLLPRFLIGSQKKLALPATRKMPRAVVQAVFDGNVWWCNGQIFTALDDLQALWDARVIVNTAEEAEALQAALGSQVECLVLDAWFEDSPKSSSMAHRTEQLLARIAHCQHVLRVDFREHSSILGAWRWRNLRRIGKQWPFELQGTHQWMQSIDDRPWQEARMAYDLRPLAGAVLDIRSAYSSAIESMPFPKPGLPWIELRAGQRQEHALHCVVWEPNDAIGRFYHPFWYSVQGARAMPGYNAGDHVHTWVLDEDLPWLARHGRILGVYQSAAPPAVEIHPLSGSVAAWRAALADETQAGYRAMHKMRLVSSHSWTWQPRDTMLAADTRRLSLHALEEYSSRLGTRVGGLRLSEDSELGLVAQGHAATDSGWYTPVAWIRLKLRSHMMRRVEHAMQHGLDIAYVSVDGMHVRGASKETIDVCHENFMDALAPWWQWRVDKTFTKGIWFRPGSYALQSDAGQWTATNLPDNLTGRDWLLWCQARATLDARKAVGYWRRPNNPQAWMAAAPIALDAQRKFRNIVRQELHR